MGLRADPAQDLTSTNPNKQKNNNTKNLIPTRRTPTKRVLSYALLCVSVVSVFCAVCCVLCLLCCAVLCCAVLCAVLACSAWLSVCLSVGLVWSGLLVCWFGLVCWSVGSVWSVGLAGLAGLSLTYGAREELLRLECLAGLVGSAGLLGLVGSAGLLGWPSRPGQPSRLGWLGWPISPVAACSPVACHYSNNAPIAQYP
jgi:hypothetical protein